MKPYAKANYRHYSPKMAREIRDLYFARVFKQTELAKVYQIAQGTVSRYVSGRVWR
jgi:DNA-binding transcriptional regulator LsrR (DeoR family)